MHSDGDIRALLDDLLVSGVDAINLQDLVNGIDWIAANLKGSVITSYSIHYTKLYEVGSSEILPEGEWQHLAIVCDGTNATMYRDGVQANTGGFTLGIDGSGKVDIIAGGYEDWERQRNNFV